jgi:hypothetical protein
MASVLENPDRKYLLRFSRQFLICDSCFWAASAISIRRHDVLTCPVCNAEVSRIPLTDDEIFTFNYDSRRGVELEFASAH